MDGQVQQTEVPHGQDRTHIVFKHAPGVPALGALHEEIVHGVVVVLLGAGQLLVHLILVEGQGATLRYA